MTTGRRRPWSRLAVGVAAALLTVALLVPPGAILGLGLYYILGIALVADLGQLVGALERETTIVPALYLSPLCALGVALLATIWGFGLSRLWRHWTADARWGWVLLTALPLVLPRFGIGALFLLTGLQLAQWGSDVLGTGMVVLSQAAVATPVIAGILCIGWRSIDPAYSQAAMEAGADEGVIFRRLTWPVLKPYVTLGAMLAFLLSLGDFYLANALSGDAPLLPGVLFSGVARNASPLYHALVAAILLVDIGFIVVIARRLVLIPLFRKDSLS